MAGQPRQTDSRTPPPRSSASTGAEHRLPAHGLPSYWHESRQPLTVLVFLLPLIIAYELGVMFLRGEMSNVAHLTLLRFFDAMGIPAISGLYMGGVVIVVILLVWHVLLQARWHVRWTVIGFMAVESFALAVPLVLLSRVIASMHVPAVAGIEELVNGGTWVQYLVISLGAGLYEELLFRMILIGMLHTLLVDVAGASNRVGCVVAIIVSAAAFAWYHTIGRSSAIPMRELTFLFLAGLYFGAIFLARGFGIVVAVHAIYDIIILIGNNSAE